MTTNRNTNKNTNNKGENAMNSTRERLIKYINGLSNEKAVCLWNDYTEENTIYYMCDIEVFFDGYSVEDIYNTINNPFDFASEYFYLYNSKIYSGNNPKEDKRSPFNAEAVVDYIIENNDAMGIEEVNKILCEEKMGIFPPIIEDIVGIVLCDYMDKGKTLVIKQSGFPAHEYSCRTRFNYFDYNTPVQETIYISDDGYEMKSKGMKEYIFALTCKGADIKIQDNTTGETSDFYKLADKVNY